MFSQVILSEPHACSGVHASYVPCDPSCGCTLLTASCTQGSEVFCSPLFSFQPLVLGLKVLCFDGYCRQTLLQVLFISSTKQC